MGSPSLLNKEIKEDTTYIFKEEGTFQVYKTFLYLFWSLSFSPFVEEPVVFLLWELLVWLLYWVVTFVEVSGSSFCFVGIL